MQDKFYENFTAYIRTYYNDCVVVFADSLTYKRHYVVQADTITPDMVHHVKAVYENAVAFNLADKKSYLTTARDMIQKAIDNEESDKIPHDAPSQINELNDDAFIKLYNRCKVQGKGVKKANVKHRPWVFLDIDLKDQLSFLREQKLVEADLAQDAFEIKLKKLSPTDKTNLIKSIVDIDAVWNETKPNMILFSGNGLHIWYALPRDSHYGAKKYAAVYTSILEHVKTLCPYIVFDEACGDINRNMRLPYTVNAKTNPPTPVEIIKMKDIETVATIVKDAFSVNDKVDENPGRIAANLGGDITDFLTQVVGIDRNNFYRGLEDMQKDHRLFSFVKDNLTFEHLMAYLNMPVRNPKASSEEGWAMCSSPFREDKNPSFAYNNRTLACKDFSENYSADYGELMVRLLDMKKEELELYHLAPTTRNEAEMHCVYVAYLNYCNKYKMPKARFKFLTEEEYGGEAELKNKSRAKKPVIPGESYYDTMALQFQQITDAAKKKLQESYTSDMDIFVKTVLLQMPHIYYFFEYNPTFKDNPMLTQQETMRLGIQKLFLDCKVSLCITGNKHVSMYVEHFGVHRPYTTFFKYNASSEEKKGIVSELASSINYMNLFGAPGLSGKNCKVIAEDIYSAYYNLKGLENDFNEHLKVSKEPTQSNVDELLIDYINHKYNAAFTKSDLRINVVSNKKYLQFTNAFVLYDSDNYEEIGLVIPNNSKTKYQLMKNNIVDIALPFSYNPGGKTPMFDKFMDFLEHEGNNAKKIIRYLFGSVLYKPDGSGTRAVIMFGIMGKNGKSVMADIVNRLITDTYTSKLAIHELSKNGNEGKISKMKLMDKLINISMDSSGDSLDSDFKLLVSGEAVEGKELYRTPITFMPRAHLLINVNKMLRLKGNESMPFLRRTLTIKLDKVVPKGSEDPDLAARIVEKEGSYLWPWIIEQARIFKEKSIYGFLTPEEICANEELMLATNDIFTFVEEFLYYDEEGAKTGAVRLSASTFKRWYSKWRQNQGRRAPGSDDILYEALVYIHFKFGNVIPEGILNKGFEYKGARGGRGIPGLYLVIPKRELQYYQDVNTKIESED